MKIKHNRYQHVQLRGLSCGSVFFYAEDTFMVTNTMPINLRTGHHTEIAMGTTVEYKERAILLMEGQP